MLGLVNLITSAGSRPAATRAMSTGVFARSKLLVATTHPAPACPLSASLGPGASKTVRLGVCQVAVCADKATNIETARLAVEKAAKGGAKIVMLPEMFNCPYTTSAFPKYAEQAPGGESSCSLSSMAKANGVYLIGGSIPESDGGKIYNTCLAFGPDGAVIGKHRKTHLFDIDLSSTGGIKFKESETLTGGDAPTMVETEYGRIGIGICYDMRFPELASLYAQHGCKMICYPGAFNMNTGPKHWELLTRARAVDNQLFVATASPARDSSEDAVYKAWGHSTVCDPMGEILATTEHDPDVIFADMDLGRVDQVRGMIPVWSQRRTDVYTLSELVM
jgi:omega-amidase